jgi:membrane-associated phospholipid phosphatase
MNINVRSIALRLVVAATLLWAIFAGIGQLLGKDATPLDRSVTDAITSNRTTTWDGITQWVSLCGGTFTVVAIAAVAFVTLRLTLRRWREAVLLALAVAGEAAIMVCITAVVDRDRPNVLRLDEAPPTSSFPSGHTGAAVALYGGLAVVAWLAAAPVLLRVLSTVIAVLLPLAIGLSRMYRGMHHLTDVLGGLALGGIWLCVVTVVIVAATRERAAPGHQRVSAR